ncbi:hypothetical protein GCM10010178_03250 [Lentzea flava]|uniref:PH domain-containing protein n=2 Tax=Lentzea flava TaxID=103732 RepID=A0ABQ2UBA1_9PSEU|nr:hypothetical protein GCM10010178_03250 [Lentzea flava]
MAQQASTADWIAAIGQAAGALFTAAAVAVALGIALADRRRLRREEDERGKRNARMVLVRGTGSHPVGQDEHGYQSELRIYFTNHSDRPIFNVYAEAWPVGTSLDEQPRWAVHSEVVLPGQPAEPTEYFAMKVTTKEPPPISIAAWRLRWTDVDGRQWYGDEPRQVQPLPFSGQPPGRYTGRAAEATPTKASRGWQKLIQRINRSDRST